MSTSSSNYHSIKYELKIAVISSAPHLHEHEFKYDCDVYMGKHELENSLRSNPNVNKDNIPNIMQDTTLSIKYVAFENYVRNFIDIKNRNNSVAPLTQSAHTYHLTEMHASCSPTYYDNYSVNQEFWNNKHYSFNHYVDAYAVADENEYWHYILINYYGNCKSFHNIYINANDGDGDGDINCNNNIAYFNKDNNIIVHSFNIHSEYYRWNEESDFLSINYDKELEFKCPDCQSKISKNIKINSPLDVDRLRKLIPFIKRHMNETDYYLDDQRKVMNTYRSNEIDFDEIASFIKFQTLIPINQTVHNDYTFAAYCDDGNAHEFLRYWTYLCDESLNEFIKDCEQLWNLMNNMNMLKKSIDAMNEVK